MSVTAVPTTGPEALLASPTLPLLAAFHAAGVLGLADVHTAEAVARIGGERDERVALALALAVRALRNGSVCLDLRTVADHVFDEDASVEADAVPVDLGALAWPEPDAWLAACRASPLLALAADGMPGAASGRPLRLVGDLLYLERYWQQEESVRVELEQRFAAAPPEVDEVSLTEALARLFPGGELAAGEEDRQRLAAETSAGRWVTVLAGGPGTGKTTTVARLLALLRAQPGRTLRVALAAPTGKAAARLEEAVRAAAAQLPEVDRERLGELSASTVHRLLGWRPDAKSRFRHDAGNRLPHDVVVVDEMSMVSLTLMARLLEAVRPDARLVLVGDPDQLSSVEAGAVLADITGPAQRSVVRLTHNWRFRGAIQELATAIRTADEDAAVAILRRGAEDVGFAELDPEAGLDDRRADSGLPELARLVRTSAEETRDAALAGEVQAALAAADRHRLLCAHRRGPYGVARWGAEVEQHLARTVPGYGEDGEFYLGRPLLVTSNDYDMGLYNGDTGVVVNTPDGVRAAFARGAAATLYPPVRLDAVQTVHAMTVHRAQGSQFGTVTFVLPPPESPLLTRELLYTAVTRATDRVLVLGTEEAVRRAVRRPANRASGLRSRLG
jgi:exodeoxyribonuclease V alpha subunit